MDSKPVYIHYGDNEFRTPDPIENEQVLVKPKGGLWASRKGDDYGWKNWCESNDFRTSDYFDKYFEFVLNGDAQVLEITEVEQLDFLPQITEYDKYSTVIGGVKRYYLDFEKLAREWDAIEIFNIHRFGWALGGWDVNCILIMNPDIVEIIQKEGC